MTLFERLSGFALGLTLTLLAAPVFAQTPPPSVSFAVVVGNNKSLGNRRAELRYADDDAARYFEILETLAKGHVSLLAAFDRDTERLFPSAKSRAEPPSRSGLLALGKRLAEQVRAAKAQGAEVELYFVFAGHGDVAEGEGFIELSDGRFRARDLKAWLKAIPFTRAHVILDSCNSFFMLAARKPGGRHFATSLDASRALAAELPNVGVFLSTSADGEAFEWSEIQSGIFSHVVRSGLLGGADANGDGQVSYLELSAFVDTATAEVTNPNMRPHVFARGPGGRDAEPLARLQRMSGVRHFELKDDGQLRVRLRDQNGLPLLDVHAERAQPLTLAVPEAWTHGSQFERQGALFGVPEGSETVTLAMLEPAAAASAGRGLRETFEPLFSRPFGPTALADFERRQKSLPASVYGVSREDTRRMQLLLDELAAAEGGRRVSEAIGSIGTGALLTGAGIGVLHVDRSATRSERREAHIWGGAMLGLGGLMALGGAGSLLAPSQSEQAARAFRSAILADRDPTQAFARADEVVQKLIAKRHGERLGEGFVGALLMLGSATGFTLSEALSDGSDSRMARRLGWGGGFVGGGMLLSDAIWAEQPVDAVARIWREDPSLNQYQSPSPSRVVPSLTLRKDAAFFAVSGSL